MKHSKLFSILVVVVLGIYTIIIGFYFLPLSDFEGDLTRLGKIPESKFGWTKSQPTIAAELLKQASWQDADVLVVGDSFSKPHLWQTVLTQQGLRVRTEDWRNIHSICKDFSPGLKEQGFNGKLLYSKWQNGELKRCLNTLLDATRCPIVRCLIFNPPPRQRSLIDNLAAIREHCQSASKLGSILWNIHI